MRPTDLQELKKVVNSTASQIDEKEIRQLFNKSKEMLSEERGPFEAEIKYMVKFF